MKPQNGANPTVNDPIDTLESNFKDVGEYLKSGTSSVEEKVTDAKKTASASVSSFTAKFDTAIKDHPIAAIGVAFGLGFLLMRLIRR